MSGLPVISGAEAVKAFGRAGRAVARRRGSNVVLIKSGRAANLSVPQHTELDPATLRGLIRDAGITVEAFLHLLRR